MHLVSFVDCCHFLSIFGSPKWYWHRMTPTPTPTSQQPPCPTATSKQTRTGTKYPVQGTPPHSDIHTRVLGPRFARPRFFRLTFWPRFYHSRNYQRNQLEKNTSRGIGTGFLHAISMRVLLALSFEQTDHMLILLPGGAETHSKTPTRSGGKLGDLDLGGLDLVGVWVIYG